MLVNLMSFRASLLLLFLLIGALLIGAPAMAQDAPADGFDLWGWLDANAPVWAVIGVAALLGAVRALAKAIPDSATGTLGWVRKIASFLSVNIPNRP